ncbi:MAG TPA: hypothetical protein VJ385_15285 [Fibrobacteria bacterium]|nr:hypothetical protein [Fibrobacteria bacterium]
MPKGKKTMKYSVLCLCLCICAIASKAADCLGIAFEPRLQSPFLTLHPWIDTAQDSAHVELVHGDCGSASGCTVIGFSGEMGVRLQGQVSEAERMGYLKVWANDLNSNFQLQRMTSWDPFEVETFTVDSAHRYVLGPYLWITKKQILQLSEKCYIEDFQYAQTPVSINANPMRSEESRHRLFNAKGQTKSPSREKPKAAPGRTNTEYLIETP